MKRWLKDPKIGYVMVSLSILLTLFYYDEGRHTLAGIFQLQNIPALVFYFAVFFGIQVALYYVLWLIPSAKIRAILPSMILFGLLSMLYAALIGV